MSLHTFDFSPAAGGSKFPSSELTELKEDAPLLLLALLGYAHTTHHRERVEGDGGKGEVRGKEKDGRNGYKGDASAEMRAKK